MAKPKIHRNGVEVFSTRDRKTGKLRYRWRVWKSGNITCDEARQRYSREIDMVSPMKHAAVAMLRWVKQYEETRALKRVARQFVADVQRKAKRR